MIDLLTVTCSASVPALTTRVVPVPVPASLIAAWIEANIALSLVRVTVTAGTTRSSIGSSRSGNRSRSLNRLATRSSKPKSLRSEWRIMGAILSGDKETKRPSAERDRDCRLLLRHVGRESSGAVPAGGQAHGQDVRTGRGTAQPEIGRAHV